LGSTTWQHSTAQTVTGLFDDYPGVRRTAAARGKKIEARQVLAAKTDQA
jgi:hypothetical protein